MTSLPRSARFGEHQHNVKQAADLLKNARKDAFQKNGFLSEAIRTKMRDELKSRTGMVAYEWQLDVAEALLLGLDCSVIAGTGAGKTTPFVLPLLVETKRVVVVISPLNALEVDQASRFKQMGLSAIAVNGETYNKTAHKDISVLKYHVVITSPEMCLEHDLFRQLLSSPKFAEKICAVIIDEAHCISQWGDKFRPIYGELGTLRAFVAANVPFLITSATLPPLILSHVHKIMHMSKKTTYHLNLGTDRPNIAWFVRMMKGGKSDLEALAFLIPNATDDEILELVQTMVFFDDINIALQALKYLRNLLPPHMHGRIAVYNSRRSRRSKEQVLHKFREGRIIILLTTEAAGMGCDIANIEQVVQFMVPNSLSIWMQRAGRGGRNRLISARAILLVQPSVFQEVKTSSAKLKKAPAVLEESDNVNYRKTVEEGLREWIEAEGCRRDVADEYFWDGSQRQTPKNICCDNCLRKSSPDHPLLTSALKRVVERPVSPSSDTEDSPADDPNSNGKRVMAEASSAANRREDHLIGARELLEAWRLETWMKLYRRCPWGIQGLLPNAILTVLATKARLQSPEDLIGAGWSPTHGRKHGTEVINILKDYDDLFKATKDDEIKARAEKKKQETALKLQEKRNKAKEERARQREIRAAQPKPPRASRAKKKTSVLPNTPPRPCMHYVSSTTSSNPGPVLEGENIPPHSSTPFTPTALPPSPFYSPIPMHYLQPSNASTSYHLSTTSHSFASAYSYPFQPTTPLNIRQSFNPYFYNVNQPSTPLNAPPSFNPYSYLSSYATSSTNQTLHNVVDHSRDNF